MIITITVREPFQNLGADSEVTVDNCKCSIRSVMKDHCAEVYLALVSGKLFDSESSHCCRITSHNGHNHLNNSIISAPTYGLVAHRGPMI
ncbi:hypothetical protein Y032_0156g3150 [Ancylostoma ceylanicum]|uniref:Uncharacterized protein n=1 Tax=Ancylostoma ceylanicum TaxID=53326 RepID=A0A016SZN8_9BILA|nr:hypothetical protein Y032_0156g3150 [Ancylostoma ceylanicum]